MLAKKRERKNMIFAEVSGLKILFQFYVDFELTNPIHLLQENRDMVNSCGSNSRSGVMPHGNLHNKELGSLESRWQDIQSRWSSIYNEMKISVRFDKSNIILSW